MRKVMLGVLILFVGVSLVQCCPQDPGICPTIEDFSQNQNIAILGDSIVAFNVYDPICENHICRSIAGQLSLHLEEKFNDYSRGGARVSGGSPVPTIGEQFESARSDMPSLNTLILNGGGNDLLSECLPDDFDAGCPNKIGEIKIELQAFLDNARSSGITQFIYVGYYHPSGIWGLWNSVLDLAMEEIIAITGPMEDVVVVDNRSDMNNCDKCKTLDAIHPSVYGSEVIAQNIFETAF